jgi:hypothetical protein
VFLRSYRLKTLRMAGLGVIVTSFLVAGRAEAFSSAGPVVQSVSNPQMASVLASTRNASLATAKLLGAGAAGSPLTMQDFDDIAIIDASVLETPLDPNEQAEGRDTITTQYPPKSQRLLARLGSRTQARPGSSPWICDGTNAVATDRLAGMAGCEAEQPLGGQVGSYGPAPQLTGRCHGRTCGHQPATRRSVCFQ